MPHAEATVRHVDRTLLTPALHNTDSFIHVTMTVSSQLCQCQADDAIHANVQAAAQDLSIPLSLSPLHKHQQETTTGAQQQHSISDILTQATAQDLGISPLSVCIAAYPDAGGSTRLGHPAVKCIHSRDSDRQGAQQLPHSRLCQQ